MGWDKNTVVHSSIDSTISTLKDLNEPYTLEVLGYVSGRGYNDYDGKQYPIRRLTYKNTTIQEIMQYNYDCDADDYLKSRKLNIEDKEDMVLSYYQHDPEYCCGDRKDCTCQGVSNGQRKQA
jgi:hypothetical protein